MSLTQVSGGQSPCSESSRGNPSTTSFVTPASSSCRPLPAVLSSLLPPPLSSRQEGGQGKGGALPFPFRAQPQRCTCPSHPPTHHGPERVHLLPPSRRGCWEHHLHIQRRSTRERGDGHSGDSLWAATPGQRMGFLKNDPGSARRKRPHRSVSMAPEVWGMFHLYSVLGHPQCVWRRG